jgi:hypothetical protein
MTIHLCVLSILALCMCVITLLLPAHAVVAEESNTDSSDTDDALFDALTQQSEESVLLVQRLISEGADVHATTHGGESTLHLVRIYTHIHCHTLLCMLHPHHDTYIIIDIYILYM